MKKVAKLNFKKIIKVVTIVAALLGIITFLKTYCFTPYLIYSYEPISYVWGGTSQISFNLIVANRGWGTATDVEAVIHTSGKILDCYPIDEPTEVNIDRKSDDHIIIRLKRLHPHTHFKIRLAIERSGLEFPFKTPLGKISVSSDEVNGVEISPVIEENIILHNYAILLSGFFLFLIILIWLAVFSRKVRDKIFDLKKSEDFILGFVLSSSLLLAIFFFFSSYLSSNFSADILEFYDVPLNLAEDWALVHPSYGYILSTSHKWAFYSKLFYDASVLFFLVLVLSIIRILS
ncbi:MAG: hypothetical protein QW176_02055, partial [Candidatus Bathyarchaeia archaeon]